MTKISFQNQEFEVMISKGDIYLQSLEKDIFFPRGQREMAKLAEAVYYKGPQEFIENTRLGDFISVWIEDNIEDWCEANQEKGKELYHHNN